MQAVCSWILVFMVIAGFLSAVHTDFYGVRERKPFGFSGFIGSVIVLVLSVAVLYGSGALDHLFPLGSEVQ